MNRILLFLSALILICGALLGGVEPGDQAPDFTLTSSKDEEMSLSELKGEVNLLVFLEKDDPSSVIMARLIEQEICDEYTSSGVNVFGILKNQTVKAASEWKESMDISYPILADKGGNVWESYVGASKSSSRIFLIDKNGVVRYSNSTLNSEEIIETMESLQSANIKSTTWWRLKQMFRKK